MVERDISVSYTHLDKINDSNNDGCTLPFSVPVKIDGNYKNYLYLGTDFLFFANGTKVYAFSLHQNPKGNSNNVVAVSMVERGNSKECYFITSDNHLYIYEDVYKRQVFDITKDTRLKFPSSRS